MFGQVVNKWNGWFYEVMWHFFRLLTAFFFLFDHFVASLVLLRWAPVKESLGELFAVALPEQRAPATLGGDAVTIEIWAWLLLPFLMGATLEYLHPLIRFCSFRTKILQRTKSILIPLCGFKSYCLRTSTLWKSVTSCDVAYLQGDSRIALGQMWRYGLLFDLQSVLKYNK